MSGDQQPQDSSNSGDEGEENNGKGDASEDSEDGSESNKEQSPAQKKASQLANEVEDIQDELGQNKSNNGQNKSPSTNDNDEVFDTPEEQARKADLANRIIEIERIFSSNIERQSAFDDNKKAIDKEKSQIAAAQRRAEDAQPINKFRLSLNRFIQNQISTEWEDSEEIFDPSYIDRGFIMPGSFEREDKRIPKINVYWDVSGSFSNPAKTEAARRAIATIDQYVKNGDIAVDTYYHADRVSSTKEGAGHSNNGNNVLKHIQTTKPDNVIIITDDGLFNTTLDTVVPGAVWMLFYDGVTQDLIKHLKGKQETKYYVIKNY